MNTKNHFVLDLGRTHKDTTKNSLDLKPVNCTRVYGSWFFRWSTVHSFWGLNESHGIA